MIKFHTVGLNKVKLHYAEAPGSGPALVIVHGLTGSHAEFLALVPDLTKQAHVYLLDLRGHGQSGRAESSYQVADYGHDVAAFLQQIVGRPAILMGHSLGGLVTIWLAAHEPHLLQGIFLEDPGFYILQMPRFGETGFYTYFVALRDYLRQYNSNGASLEEMVAYVRQAPVNEAQTMLELVGPEAVRERALQLHQLDPAVLDPALEGSLLNDAEPDALLSQIRCPIHLLVAQVDLGGALNDRDVQRAVLQILHCTYAVIQGAGHDIHLDQPKAFVSELKQFLTVWS